MPNGVGIARPPANNAPPGLVWQAMQSPARARYSPLRDQRRIVGPRRDASASISRRSVVRTSHHTLLPQFGSLPQVSGIASVPFGTGTDRPELAATRARRRRL